MADEKTLPHMKPVVLAKNDPAIVGVFPHACTRFLRLKTVCKGEERWLEC